MGAEGLDLRQENERLRAELARLQESLAKGGEGFPLDSAFTVFPALLFLFSRDDRYLAYRAGEGLYAPPAEFLGKRIDEVLPPPTGTAFLQSMRQARETPGRVETVEYSLPMPPGTRHFEARILGLADGRVLILSIDVTDRRLAQDAARSQAEHLRRVLSLSPAAIYSLRVTPGAIEVASVSENVRSILGYEPQEVAAAGFWAHNVHPDDWEGAQEGAARMLAEGHAVQRYRFRHAAGHWRWIRDEARVVQSAGEPTEVVGSLSDVTAQQEVEEQLRESQERFRRAYEDAPVGMALVGLDERFLSVNGMLCRILGYPAEVLLGKTVPEITYPEDRETERQKKSGMLDGTDSSFRMEKRYLRADGQVVWGSLSASLVRDAGGKPLYIIGQLEDVTDRRRAEDALRASEERFRQLIERAPDLLAVFDAAGRVAYASPSAVELLGYPPERLLGRPAHDLVVAEDAGRAGALLAELAGAPGATRRIELRMRRADGSHLVFDSLVRNLLHVPSIAGFVVNSRDVTQQRQLEGQLLQSQKLESIGRLAGGVAHDFNNLLIGILGYAQFLEEGIRSGNPSLEDLGEIRKAGERARDLTAQLLTVARRQVSEPRVIDLNGVLRDSEKFLRRTIGEDVTLSLHLEPRPWAVRADPGSLQQVLLNLAVNARHAMPRGGKLTIETANVVLDERYAASHQGVVPGRYVLLAVSDSGLGMSEEVQAHIFEPFFTTKAPGLGTGLGLATVHGIVKQSGGHIWVYSEVGRGTTFKIYLPPTDEALAPSVPDSHPPARQGTETVLVAEDEPGVRELIVRTLQGNGYRVLAASGGKEAGELAAQHGEIHLLLTDVVMPDVSGVALAQQLVAQRPGLKVLYTSGYTENAIVHHGVLDPGVRFLAKPFVPASLLEAVRRALDGT